MKFIAYARRSSEDNREKQALSVSAQIDEIKRKFKEIEIVEWLQESHSAFDIGRPCFDYMIQQIRAGKIDGIVCWHPDRIARNPIDGGTIIDLLDKGLLKELKFCSYTFNNDAEGKMMLGIMFTQSKYFSDKLSKDVKRGMEKKIRNGEWPHLAPPGYINTKVNEIGRQEINPDPDRFDLIRKLWDLMLTGAYSVESITQIADHRYNIRTIQRKTAGGKEISRGAMYDLFRNPIYCGMMLWKGDYYDGKHTPMVTKDEFDSVQILLKDKGRPRPKSKEFPFTGLIKCGICGSSITAETKHKILASGEIKYYTYYHCSKRSKDQKCFESSVNEVYIHDQITKLLENITIPQTFVDWAVEYLNELNSSEVQDRGQAYFSTEKEYSRVQGHLDRLTEMCFKGLIDDAEFKDQKVKLLAEKQGLKSQLDNLESRANHWLESAVETFEFARNAKYRFEHGYFKEKKIIAHQIGSNFILKNQILTLEVNKPLEIISNGLLEIKKEANEFELENIGSSKVNIDTTNTIKSSWLGRRDSNPRMSGPKPGALPLGHSPTFIYQLIP